MDTMALSAIVHAMSILSGCEILCYLLIMFRYQVPTLIFFILQYKDNSLLNELARINSQKTLHEQHICYLAHAAKLFTSKLYGNVYCRFLLHQCSFGSRLTMLTIRTCRSKNVFNRIQLLCTRYIIKKIRKDNYRKMYVCYHLSMI